MVSATIGVTRLAATGYADWSSFGPSWLTWWLGDAIGIPGRSSCSSLGGRSENSPGGWLAAEAALIVTSLVAVSLVVFGGLLPSAEKDYPLEILCVPIILWPAFRFGHVAWRGTLCRGSANTSLLLLQVYVGVVAIMSIVVAASVWERK